ADSVERGSAGVSRAGGPEGDGLLDAGPWEKFPEKARLLADLPAATAPLVPTLRVGIPSSTLRVGPPAQRPPGDAERPGRHSHAERGNELNSILTMMFSRRCWGDRRGLSKKLPGNQERARAG